MEDGIQAVELTVLGVCCIECCQGVDAALRATPGVMDVRILGTSEKVLVAYRDGSAEPGDLLRAVERAGHQVQAWRSARTSMFENAPGMDAQVAALDANTPAGAAHGQPSTSKFVGERTFATLRLALLGLVAAIALAEIAGESLGLLRSAVEFVPAPVAVAAVVFGGYPIFRRAYLGLRVKRVNTDLVMSVGILAAAGIREFVSAALIVFFVTVAHYLEDLTTSRARRAVEQLAALAPKTARVKGPAGEIEVSVDALRARDVVVVRPGERIPVDGKVVAGQSSVNQAPITGESIPVEKGQGDDVFAGTINELGFLEVEALRVGEDSTLGRIIQLVQEAEAHKAPVQRFADRFSAAFLPLVLTAASLTLLFGHHLVAAIAVLVAACPCAVGLATPLSVVAAVGAGARQGLLIKGGLYLEALAKVDTLVVDKTGTLTYGRPVVSDALGFGGFAADEAVRLAATLEHYSEHPLATAVLTEAAKRGLAPAIAEDVRVLLGRGITGVVEHRALVLGTRRLLGEHGAAISPEVERKATELEAEGKTVVLLAREGEIIGLIAASDTLRPGVAAAVAELRSLGLGRVVVLTGDNERAALAIARQAGITAVAANLLPEDKIATVRRLQAEGRRVAMIGDGINDAPALTQADVGIAMGLAGTDIALEAADVALLRDDWTQVPEAVRLGRRTYGVIRQNIVFGIAFNVLVMGLASTGLIGPAIAAASQAVPDVAVALNASRLLRLPWRQGTITAAKVTGA